MDREKEFKRVRLKKGKFKWDTSESLRGKVDLINLQPKWPGTYKAKLGRDGLSEVTRVAYDMARPNGIMVLWMYARQLHRSPFDPINDVQRWKAVGSIVSGTGAMAIGFVYGRNFGSDFGSKQILDPTGTGPSSSITMKWLLEFAFRVGGTPLKRKGLVLDPWAHPSVQLAKWSRRMGLRYRGYIASRKRYEAASLELAQVELPGIQGDLLKD